MQRSQVPKEDMKPSHHRDRIEGTKIILNGGGIFPKQVIIMEPGQIREYELRKTPPGNYYLVK